MFYGNRLPLKMTSPPFYACLMLYTLSQIMFHNSLAHIKYVGKVSNKKGNG